MSRVHTRGGERNAIVPSFDALKIALRFAEENGISASYENYSLALTPRTRNLS